MSQTIDIEKNAQAPSLTLLQRLGATVRGAVKAVHYVSVGVIKQTKGLGLVPSMLTAFCLCTAPLMLKAFESGEAAREGMSVAKGITISLSLTGVGLAMLHETITDAYQIGKYTVEMRRSEARNALSRSGSPSI